MVGEEDQESEEEREEGRERGSGSVTYVIYKNSDCWHPVLVSTLTGTQVTNESVRVVLVVAHSGRHNHNNKLRKPKDEHHSHDNNELKV